MKKLPILIATALILSGSTGAYAYYQTPVSFVSLDINPSIELGVNAFGVVVSSEAYNEDGEKVLENIDVEGGSVQEAVNEIVDSAIAEGYVQEDGTSVISVTAETDDEELAEELNDLAEAGVEEALEENETEAEIEKDNIALERRDEAIALGITPGKLNLIQKLQVVNPDATVEDFIGASVKDIMKATHEAKGIGQGKEDKDKDKDKDKGDKDDKDDDKDEDEDEDKDDESIADESRLIAPLTAEEKELVEQKKDALEKEAEQEKDRLEREAEQEKDRLEKEAEKLEKEKEKAEKEEEKKTEKDEPKEKEKDKGKSNGK